MSQEAVPPKSVVTWRTVTVSVAIIAAAWAGGTLVRGSAGDEWPRQSFERGGAGVAFVPNGTCIECHQPEATEWRGSHHDRAMEPATQATVLGDFDGASFEHMGVTTQFFQRGPRFFVNAQGPDGAMSDFEVLYTFGVEPLQQYLVALPGGRLQALTVAWDTERNRWFELYPDERVEPGDPLHWTGRLQRWNSRCAECHSTDLRLNYDAETGTYQTTWAEVNVSCQSCHGPGEGHLAWAESASAEARSGSRGLVVDAASSAPGAQLQACARCHSRRSQLSAGDVHGRPFMDDFVLALLREDLYHADGQILEEVYVTGSFLQSKMHQRGVQCTDCHNPHSLNLLATGNALCTRCHQQEPPPAFPTLQSKLYDSAEHHYHEAGSAGAQCVDCHMPSRTYMIVDPRRDHSFRVPRPDLSVEIGTPNACTMCHTTETDQWAADAVVRWYGSTPRLDHYATTLDAGRRRDVANFPALIQLAGDANAPGIVRATAIELLQGINQPEVLQLMVEVLYDPDPLVRLAAVSTLEAASPQTRATLLPPFLNDSIAAVRMAAARALAPVGQSIRDQSVIRALQAALTEYQLAQEAQADVPESHHNLGNFYANMGQTALAAQSYNEAIRLDSTFIPARVNLATIYNQMARNGDAERLLRETIQLAPDLGDLHYSLGLLLAEVARLDEAVEELGRAAEMLPDRPRVMYNYGLALQQLGRMEEAETALLKALEGSVDDPDFMNGLAFYYKEAGEWDEALRYARRLASLFPEQPGPEQLIAEIEAARAAQ